MGIACHFYLKSRHGDFLFLTLEQLSLGSSLSLSPNAMPDFQRWENWDSLWIGLGEDRGVTFALALPQILGFAHGWILFYWGSFFWGMKQINCKRIPGNSLCALPLQYFFSETLWEKKKKIRSLKCLMQMFQNRQGSPAFLMQCSTVKLRTNLLPAMGLLTKDGM